MAINIGNFNNLNRYDTIDNNFTLNSYTNSNVLFLNIDNTAYDTTLINYKNLYYTGYKSGNYIISDSNNNDLIEISKKSFNINTSTFINNYLNINNLLLINSNTVNIYSNLNIYLEDNLNIYDSSNNIILDIIDNNILISLNNNNYININSNIDFHKNLNISTNNILYVDTITNYTFGCNVSIYNATLHGLQVITSIFNDYIHINNILFLWSVLHLMGEETEMRSKVFFTGMSNICDCLEPAIADNFESLDISAIPRQLGLSRDRLLAMAEVTYRYHRTPIFLDYHTIM